MSFAVELKDVRKSFGKTEIIRGASLSVKQGERVAIIEMVYHRQLNSALGSELPFMGATLHTDRIDSWFGAVFVLLTGAAMFELTRRHFNRQWGEVQEDIEKEIKRRESIV